MTKASCGTDKRGYAVASCDALFVVCLFQGNLFEFLRLTGWRGSKVLYFGDHLYSDLAVSVKSWWPCRLLQDLVPLLK